MVKSNIYELEKERYLNQGKKYTIYYENKLCRIGDMSESEIKNLLSKFNENNHFLPPKLIAEVENLKDYVIYLRSNKIMKIKERINYGKI